MDFELKSLIDKLNPPCRKALEGSAGLCVAQTNYNVELEHLFLKLLETPNLDVERVMAHYGIHLADASRDLTYAIDRFKRGNNQTPALSPHIPALIREAWMIGTLHLGVPMVRSGALLLAVLENVGLRGLMLESLPAFMKIPREELSWRIREVIAGSTEDAYGAVGSGGAAVSSSGPSLGAGGTGSSDAAAPARTAAGRAGASEALDLYTHDLTEAGRAGKIDPILGRDAEIRQIIDILTRRRQNNPILTGDAGVGKTAVVEGLALKIVQGDVPPPLRDVSLRALDLGLLQAGAGVKGEFENRLKMVIAEVKAAPNPVILFIDEAHTMIGAGGAAGQADAANLLKPALARGELRTIAATTWGEYKRYFEKDPALARRFQVVKVEEPDEAAATAMLRGVVPVLERHHGVRILDEAVREAVRLSHRYISARKLPDKAVSVLDTACARVALGQNATPAALENAVSRMARLELELDVLEREQLSSHGHAARIIELERDLEEAAAVRAALEERWVQERELVEKIVAKRAEIEKDPDDDAGNRARMKELDYLRDALEAVQAKEPMVHAAVDPDVVASVISGWTGIPVGSMLSDEIRSVLTLESRMAERIVGQPQALDAVSRRIRTSRAGMDDPGKPVGVFLLVGPSGVGKTETAVTLAELLYGGERNMVTVNMSEYQEAHTVSALKGAPPGYVGYGQGGVLTEAVRRNPYSLVLLDEVEKAHADVMELFFQVFDKGRLEDGEGVEVDFRNTIILLTSNVGSEEIVRACAGGSRPDADVLVERLWPELTAHFKAALLGRLVVIPYYPLGEEEIRGIVRLKLAKITRRFRESHRADLTIDGELIESIARRCTDTDTGARTIDNILTHTLLPELSEHVLERMAGESPFWSVRVKQAERGGYEYLFTPPIPKSDKQ